MIFCTVATRWIDDDRTISLLNVRYTERANACSRLELLSLGELRSSQAFVGCTTARDCVFRCWPRAIAISSGPVVKCPGPRILTVPSSNISRLELKVVAVG